MIFKNIILFPLRLINGIFPPIYEKRLAKYVAPLCDNNSKILDVGCDNGSTAKRIMEFNPSLKIVGIDVQSNRPSKIPRKIYDGKNIPYPDDSFDIVIVLDVLHHTKDILLLLKEIKRVSKKYIIIKDHMTYSVFSRDYISFADYISNLPVGIKCTFNYPSPQKWNYYFNKLKLKVVAKPKTHFGYWGDQRYNPIFKLEKRK